MTEAATHPDGAVAAAIARIRKLMRYASDPNASEGEIENAMGHARRLMDEFHLDQAAVAEEPEDAPGMAEVGYCKTIERTKREMARVPCLLCDVECVVINNRLEKSKSLAFVGLPRNIAVARALYAELLESLNRWAKRTTGETSGPQHRSYCHGFILRLVQRAMAAKRQSAAVPCINAIVVASDSAARKAKAALKPRPARLPKINISEIDYFARGHMDGNRVSLSKNGLSHTPGRQSLLFGDVQ